MSSTYIHNQNKMKLVKNDMNSVKYTPKEIFNKYLSIEEIKNHPEITPALKGDKKIRLDILSRQKPRMINIKGMQNQNKIKIATRLNSFNKIFFDYYKNQQNSNNDIKILNQENKDFSKNYKNSNKSKEKEKFQDIKSEYEKRNYYLSPFEGKKNLFNGNILLSNKEELKNYILYDLGTNISNAKSLSFLHKINKRLGDKTSEKELKEINAKLDLISLGKDKIQNDRQTEIQKSQNDIINIKETINTLDELNNFLDIDNKIYLEMLRNDGSRGSSAKISTRVNSAVNCFENVKVQYNNNIINDKIKQDKNNLSNMIDNSKNVKKSRHKNRIYNLGHIDTSDNNHKGINQNKHLRNYTKTVDNDLSKSHLENLYDSMSTKDNLFIYQNDIKNYLKNRKYDVSLKINPSIICNNFEKTREKLCQSDFLKRDMQLRKQIEEGNISNAERINNKDFMTKKKINNIEDKIIKIYCDINNPRKESY